MKLEDQVCSLELALKLRELGVKQDSYFYYCYSKRCEQYFIYSQDELDNYDRREDLMVREYSAFSVAELGIILSSNKNLIIISDFSFYEGINKVMYSCAFEILDRIEQPLTETSDEKESDARSKMLIYLIENKFVTVEEINARMSE